MNDLLRQETTASSPSSHNRQRPTFRRKLLYFFVWIIVLLALVAGVMLLVRDIFTIHFSHAPVSAAPLLLIGAAYLGFQALTLPRLLDLFRSLIVSSAFILWGIDQMLPSGWSATTLGDVVIVLYVIDLSWLMIDYLRRRKNAK